MQWTRHSSFPRVCVAFVFVGCLLLAAAQPGCGDPGSEGSDPAPREARRSPNLLLITLDTTRWDALGSYGQPRPTTPHIDLLADAGVLFEEVTTSNPETLPAHATILTGTWPFMHGVRSNGRSRLSDENETLAEHLARHGYRTVAETATPVLAAQTQIGQGFGQFTDVDGDGVVHHPIDDKASEDALQHIRSGSDITDRGLRFLRGKHDQPFFLWLHYFDPHSPIDAPPEFLEKIPDDSYLAEVAYADHQVGRVVAALEELGLRDDTLVVVTADHGEANGDHSERGHSFYVYQSTMRVPLVFAGLPPLEIGRRIATRVRTVDIVPTVLDFLGVPPLEDVAGVTLRPLIAGDVADLELPGYGEAEAFSNLFPMPRLRFVREGRWKYIHKVEPELYDLEADPGELVNVYDAQPEVAQRLRSKLASMTSVSGVGSVAASEPIDDGMEAQLAALGYVVAPPSGSAERDLDTMELSGTDARKLISDAEKTVDAFAMLEREDHARALALLEPIFERNPDSTAIGRLVAQSLSGVGRESEALDILMRVFEDRACESTKLASLDKMLRQHKREEDLARVREYAASHCADNLGNLNNFAWLLSTSTREELRNGPRAVEIMNAMLAGPGQRTPGRLDTLAAAYAEVGDFEQAIRIQTEAVEAIRGADLPEPVGLARMSHLESYRAGRPLREPL